MKSIRFISNYFVLLTAALLLCGCPSSHSPDVSSVNKTNMRRLYNCYMMYLGTHKQRGPDDKEQLLDYLQNDPAAQVRLSRMGIQADQIEDIFVSERDGEPFVVRYGLAGALVDHAVVFEASGVDGKRMVGLGEPREVGEDEYEGYLSGKIKPASFGGTQTMSVAAEEE